MSNNKSELLKQFPLTEVKLDPRELVIVTEKDHPLWQERGEWAVNELLVQSIKEKGFSSVVLIGEEFDEETFIQYVVVAGRQRTKAAVAAGLTEVPCLDIGPIHLIKPSLLQAIMLEENERRVNSSTLEKAQDAQRLYETKLAEFKPAEWPVEEEWKANKDEKKEALEFVAGVFGLSTSRVKTLAYIVDEEKCSPALTKAIQKGDVSFNAALRLVTLSKEEQEAVLEKAKPVIARNQSEASARGGRSEGLSRRQAEALAGKNNRIILKRDYIEKVKARRHTPPEVKEFCKELLNPGSTGLDYLPGVLPKGKDTRDSGSDNEE